MIVTAFSIREFIMAHSLHLIRFALIFFGAIVVLRAADKPVRLRVALVFDDGPVVEQNTQFLALLAREKVRVTFSHVGRNVVAHPELSRAVAEAGHEIINHSYTHPHFKELDDATIQREVRETQEAIRGATGRAPRWFWTPFGDWDDRIAAAVRAAGLEHYPVQKFHFIDTKDWDTVTDAATLRKRATTDIKDGTVILCHEWPKQTLAELPAILEELKRQGVTFVTFSELAAGA